MLNTIFGFCQNKAWHISRVAECVWNSTKPSFKWVKTEKLLLKFRDDNICNQPPFSILLYSDYWVIDFDLKYI